MNFRSDEVYLFFGKSKSGKTQLASYFASQFSSVVVYETLLKPKNYLSVSGIKETKLINDISLVTKLKDGKVIPFYKKIKFYPMSLKEIFFDQFISALFKRRDTFVILEEAQLLFRIGKNPSELVQGFLRAGGHDWALGQAFLTQRIGDLNKIVLTQLNHAFIFKTSVPNDLEYIEDCFGNHAKEIVENLRTIGESTRPEDHEFLYIRDFEPVAIGYLNGNELKFTEQIKYDNFDKTKVEDSGVRSMPEEIRKPNGIEQSPDKSA
jgi:hypothetical protein